MKNNKETRTCIACRNKNNKSNLIRIVNTIDNGVVIDFKQDLQGRGAYICKNKECFDKMEQRKILSKALKINIGKEKYNELRGVMFDR